MRITITEFVTLDGVSQGPGSSTEDTIDDFERGGWLVPYLDRQFVRRASERLDLVDGLPLGRRLRKRKADELRTHAIISF